MKEKSGRIAIHRNGAALVMVVMVVTLFAALAVVALEISTTGVRGKSGRLATVKAFYAAESGIAWARRMIAGMTTLQEADIMALNGAAMSLPGGNESFVVVVKYQPPDVNVVNGQVTFRVTGRSGEGAARYERKVEASFLVPPPTLLAPSLAENFDATSIATFDTFFAATVTGAPHGGGLPITSAGTSGDLTGAVTLGGEPGGTPGLLRLQAPPLGDLRVMTHTGECLRWSRTRRQNGCAAMPGCVATPECGAIKGASITPDIAGYQNYFVRVRFRLISGSGAGVYFRTVYENMADPVAIDFATLSGYVWQYDSGYGYLAPCSLFTTLPGADELGALVTLRLERGLDYCPAGCGAFTRPWGPGPAYPFFCPENRTNDSLRPGWEWQNGDWLGRWRTLYLYVYQDRATLYLGREEAPGGEESPELIAEIDLAQMPPLYPAGDIGIRLWNGAVVEFDYFALYPNDANHSPATFAGSPQ